MKITITKGDNPVSRLFAETPSIASEAEYRKLMIVEELLTLMAENGISRGELAKRMEVQPSRVTSILSGTNNFTIETLVRAGRAVGADIELHFVPMKKAKAQGEAAKPRADEESVSKVAEDPTPYRTKRKPVKPLDDPDFIGAEAALRRASAKAIAKARAAGLEPIVSNPADLPKKP
jgi:plasmid maintenance system antidote protein VapI